MHTCTDNMLKHTTKRTAATTRCTRTPTFC